MIDSKKGDHFIASSSLAAKMNRSMVSGFVAILCLIKCILGDESVPYPEVEIESGRLVGVYGENRKGERYAEFLGVPYGHVEKRFDVSVPIFKIFY